MLGPGRVWETSSRESRLKARRWLGTVLSFTTGPLSQDVVNCVGGMGVLLPLLERVAVQPQEAEAGPCETHDLVGPELTSGRNPQGLLLPLGKSSGE